MALFMSLASAIIASVLTAIITLWLYRSEKWWELKVSTYMKILESLHYIKQHFEHEYKIFIYSNPRVCDEIFESEVFMNKLKYKLKNREYK